VIWKAKKRKHNRRLGSQAVRRRSSRPERLELRRLLAADPIHVGVVYIETDYLEIDQDVGGDSQGDRFILSFTGGAPDTELTEVRIRTDKDGDGISVGDPIYDTAIGYRGKDQAHDFQLVRTQDTAGQQIRVSATVDDGGQELVLRLTNFHAGDRIEFTIDVDEVLRNVADLEIFNDRLDVITSGQEFQDSILEATFNAPHYETAHTDSIFLNDYGDPAADHGLNLPADESDDPDSRPNRSAAAVGTTNQVPKPVEISGHVWLDNDLDTVREPGEMMLPGVEIALWRKAAGGSYVDTGHRATTDAGGKYEFPKSLGLLPGTYRLVESQPSGLLSVAAVPGTIGGVATGVTESHDVLTEIAIPLGDLSGINYDFAEAETASLSGFVYQDNDNDGVRDASEAGIAGVRVQLIPINTIAPQSTLTVTTADDGSYAFTGLIPGTYEVIEVDQPPLLDDGLDTAGTINGQRVGQAQNPGDKITGIALDGGDDGIDYNFGELPYGSIAGFVYLAAPGQDCYGEHDGPGNTPLAGVVIQLQDDLGNTVAETTTATNGGYNFENVPIGEYRIVEFTPAGLIDGSAHVGRINNVRVGTAVGGGLIRDIVMTPAGVGVEYNFCEGAPAAISGYVYHDRSDDGRRDSGEEPIANVLISLVDDGGQIVATTTTDSTGLYEFTDVSPGRYTLVEAQPAEYLDGRDSIGTVDGQRRGQPGGNDRLTDIELKQGESGVEYNFGELLPAALFGRVHVDIDGDCILDEDEQTLAGVTIRLLDATGNEVARTTTDARGEYSFENLRPGRYQVVEVQPAGFFEGGALAGTAGGTVVTGSHISEITLDSGETGLNYDFCERPPAQINGSVFADQDGDCLFHPDEIGIEGVRVELYDDADNLLATTQTDASGNYRFTNLPAGSYTVREIQPPGWWQGGQRAGSAGGDDSVADVISQIPVGWGQRLTQYNFCELQPASISGVVFVDGNGDCYRQADELAIAGVTIELRDARGRFVTRTITDAGGNYQFDNLTPGSYQVFEQQPDGYFQGGQTVGTGDGEVLGSDLLGFRVAAGDQLVDYNFCEVPPASIRGLVHVDDDGDCVVDPDERPLAGVRIELRDASGRTITVTQTDSSGRYEFSDLRPGQYQVFERQPDGFFQGGQRVGSGVGQVLGDDLLGVTLAAGEDVVNYDFCELPPSSISGRVWQESEPDQQFDPGDKPLSGVRVDLIDGGGSVVAQTRTDGTGQYSFTGLAPGVYGVREQQPTGLFHGGQVVGDLGGQVGGDDLLLGIMLTGGTHGHDYDFPEVPPAAVAGYVFQDGDAIRSSNPIPPEQLREYRDGQFTADDTPLGGVTLELRNILGRPVDSSRALPGTYTDGPIRITTNAEGYYEFTGLRPGTYHVYQVQPGDYFDGLDTPGTTGGVAVNPADTVNESDRILIQTLSLSAATDPNDDAILNVTLAGGARSENNNFSEIVIDDPQLPPVAPPRPDEASPEPLIETFDSHVRLMTFATPVTLRNPVTPINEWAVSWHLSVVNGGFPRGKVGDDGIIRAASAQFIPTWSATQYDRGRWSLFSEDGSRREPDHEISLGVENGIALAGDFDGDGSDEAVIYAGGQWFVDLNGNGRWDSGDLWLRLGTDMDYPVVGDWDGDGKDDIGIFGRQWLRDPYRIKRDPGLPDPDNKRRRNVDTSRYVSATDEDRGEDRERWLQRGDEGALRADAVDHVFQYGDQPDTPITGDWNGDGIDQIGIYRAGTWLLDTDGDGRWSKVDVRGQFGRPGDEPIVGDFNGDDIDEIGVVRGDLWIIDTDGDRRITGNDLQIQVPRESADSQPVVGDFDGDGRDEPGYYDEAA